MTEEERHRGLLISIWEGAFATIHMTVTTGVFLTGFVLSLGANDFEIGLITAIPLLTQIVQIPAAYLLEHRGYRRWLASIPSLLGRELWLIMALLPFLPQIRSHPIPVFIWLFVLSSSLLSFSATPWVSWMSDLVPRNIRGRYFGTRNMIVGLVTIAVSIGAGLLIDFYESQRRPFEAFLLIYGLASASALVAFILLLHQEEPPFVTSRSTTFGQLITEPLRNRAFRRLLVYYLYWTFAIGVAAPFWTVYLIKILHWNYTQLAILNIIASFLNVMLQPSWGRLTDRVGYKPVLLVGAVGVVAAPILYSIATPDFPIPIWVSVVISGIVWSGLNLALFNIVIHTLPHHHGPSFLAMKAALTGLTNCVAMVFGGWFVHTFANFHFSFGHFHLVNYHLLFLLTLFLRLFISPLVKRLEEPEAKGVGTMVHLITVAVNRRIGFGRQFWFLHNHHRASAAPKASSEDRAERPVELPGTAGSGLPSVPQPEHQRELAQEVETES